MAGKRDKPEDIVLKLRQIEVPHGIDGHGHCRSPKGAEKFWV